MEALFRPRSVAVVGASRTKGTVGYEVLRNLVRSEFTGTVYPVNPDARVVQTLRCYPAVKAIPDPVDLAIIVVPAEAVLEAVEDCGEKGVRSLIVISGGFAETGAAGIALQKRLAERVQHHGMCLVGPNCLGVLNADPAVQLNATTAHTFPPSGNVAFSSQSGGLGLAILDEARSLGVGISQFVSLGNNAGLSGNDLLEHWANDPLTQVILIYLEGFGNPQRFMEVARRVSRRKPIVVVKSGRTEAGARAASSHTGALAGMDVAVDALLGQAGVIRTDTIHELFDVARLVANQPVPKGKRVAIITNAGGPGTMASDACESNGLEVVQLDAETQRALREYLPSESAVANPIDLIANAPASAYSRALRTVLDDPQVDAAIVLFVTPIAIDPLEVANAIVAASERRKKPVLACLMGRHGVAGAVEVLRASRIPLYDFPESAAAALAHAASYGDFLKSPEGHLVRPAGMDLDRVSRFVAAALETDEARWLRPDEVSRLLEATGIRSAQAIEARTEEEAIAAATTLGFPVVVKLMSDTIQHKTEVGGVLVGLDTPEEVRQAWQQIAARLESRGRKAEMSGVLVQQMLRGAVETYIGATRDKTYGSLVGFGMGGTAVEVWKDIAFRVVPLSDVDAQSMLTQIRARPLLQGFRGGPVVDQRALVDAVLRVSQLVKSCPEITEIDLNPVMATPTGAVVADARIRVSRQRP